MSMNCPSCRGTEFYEDDQGNMVCHICGTQSQEYIAESNDADDGVVIATMGGRLRALRLPKQARQHIKIEAKDIVQTADVLTLMSAYQYCLIALMQIISKHLRLSSIQAQSLEDTIKDIWFAYLPKLQESADRFDFKIIDCFTKKGVCIYEDDINDINTSEGNSNHQTDEQTHAKHLPVLPSKPLLFGILYMSIRMHRYTLLPCDLVHLI